MATPRKGSTGKTLKKLGTNHSKMANLLTAQVLEDSKKGKNLKTFNSKKGLFKDLGL